MHILMQNCNIKLIQNEILKNKKIKNSWHIEEQIIDKNLKAIIKISRVAVYVQESTGGVRLRLISLFENIFF